MPRREIHCKHLVLRCLRMLFWWIGKICLKMGKGVRRVGCLPSPALGQRLPIAGS